MISNEKRDDDAAASPVAQSETSAATFVDAMDETKRRSRRRMPLVALIALVTLLLSGAAWAAWTVYVEVVAPWIEAQQQQQEPVEEQAAEEEAEEEPEKTEPEATGDPRHVLQVAEILAMNPEEIASFLESQGLKEQEPDAEALARGYGSPATAWQCSYDDATPFLALEESGIAIEPQRLPDSPMQTNNGPSVIFGKDVMPPHDLGLLDTGEYAVKEGDLAAGTKPTAVHISNLPLPLLDDDSARALIDACALPEASASFSTDSVIESPFPSTIRVGFIDIDEERYCWYIGQTKRPAESSGADARIESFIGCCPMTAAQEAVIDAELYTEQEYDEADDDTKALMVGQSILQGIYIGNGGYRNNLVTGEYEASYGTAYTNNGENSPRPPERIWVTEEELRELAGDEVADGYFGFLTDAKQ